MSLTPKKKQAKRILFVYTLGLFALFLLSYTSFSIPCLWKLVTGIPSPGCGLSRAFVLAGQFQLIQAIQMNFLFLPLSLLLLAYFFAAMMDLFFHRPALFHLNAILKNKWLISFTFLLVMLSWYVNIVRGI